MNTYRRILILSDSLAVWMYITLSGLAFTEAEFGIVFVRFISILICVYALYSFYSVFLEDE
jgi:hypothetical protein